ITTSGPDPEQEYRALEQGADDFIAKPHLMQSLSRRIQRSALFYASAGVALTRQGETPLEAMKRMNPEVPGVQNTNKDKYCLWRKEII
ncbi:diguanylate cyclase, partial [Enterocloster hominis]